MAISLELIHQLAARREGPALDFKRDQYDWNVSGNLELAKDLMSIANGLSSGSAPGYILIGVDERADGTGDVIGVDISKHLRGCLRSFHAGASRLSMRRMAAILIRVSDVCTIYS
jgi:predicted HTH transcriptional regulator